MAYRQLLGEYQDAQVKATQVLSEEGPLTYEDLKTRIGFERDSEMREVMRGLQWNGLTDVQVTDQGGYEYGAADGVDLDELLSAARSDG